MMLRHQLRANSGADGEEQRGQKWVRGRYEPRQPELPESKRHCRRHCQYNQENAHSTPLDGSTVMSSKKFRVLCRSCARHYRSAISGMHDAADV
jgi:hypothetical protein